MKCIQEPPPTPPTSTPPSRREGTKYCSGQVCVRLLCLIYVIAHHKATRYDEEIAFYRDVPEILHRMREAGIVIAACSRTHAPKLYVYSGKTLYSQIADKL